VRLRLLLFVLLLSLHALLISVLSLDKDSYYHDLGIDEYKESHSRHNADNRVIAISICSWVLRLRLVLRHAAMHAGRQFDCRLDMFPYDIDLLGILLVIHIWIREAFNQLRRVGFECGPAEGWDYLGIYLGCGTSGLVRDGR
jgi:hypothetical protein